MPVQECGNVDILKPSPVSLREDLNYLNIGYLDIDPKDVEKSTREQANCLNWHNLRKNRVTASNFGKIMYRKSEPTEKFIKNFCQPASFFSNATHYGKCNESKAKASYLQQNRGVHCHECGFVVNKNFAFLGATPDGVVCDEGKTGIMEIKCPYSARNMTVKDACTSDEIRDFFLEIDQNETMCLKKSHSHYAQVQGQLMITGVEFCDFVVYTQSDLFVQRIFPDVIFMEHLLTKLVLFFKDHMRPYLSRLNKASTEVLNLDHGYSVSES